MNNKVMLQCPFCGKVPEIWQDEYPHGPGGPIPTDWVISCCVEMREPTKKKLVERWNRRIKSD